MIDLVDQHIVGRLQRITTGGESVRVYPYMPGREQGETRFPCISLVLRAIFQSFIDARPNCDVFAPIGEEITIQVPYGMGSGEATGPTEYEAKPHPTPVELVYELGIFATRVSDHRSLLEGVYQSFPPGYMASVGESRPLFIIRDVVEDDDFEKPLFAKLLMLRVTDLWLERAEVATYSSMIDIDLDIQT